MTLRDGRSPTSSGTRSTDDGRITAGSEGIPERTDVLVIGLGVTGAGVALDAVTRGLDVVAVDAWDLAWGTSRFSSKLVHGGLRYLATGNVGIARRSAVERGMLMTRNAPHLVKAMTVPSVQNAMVRTPLTVPAAASTPERSRSCSSSTLPLSKNVLSRSSGSRGSSASPTVSGAMTVDHDGVIRMPLQRPASRTIIYEMHVRGFTRDPSSGLPERTRGTYAGLVEKIPYLQQLGISAVELMPRNHSQG